MQHFETVEVLMKNGKIVKRLKSCIDTSKSFFYNRISRKENIKHYTLSQPT